MAMSSFCMVDHQAQEAAPAPASAACTSVMYLPPHCAQLYQHAAQIELQLYRIIPRLKHCHLQLYHVLQEQSSLRAADNAAGARLRKQIYSMPLLIALQLAFSPQQGIDQFVPAGSTDASCVKRHVVSSSVVLYRGKLRLVLEIDADR